MRTLPAQRGEGRWLMPAEVGIERSQEMEEKVGNRRNLKRKGRR